MVARRCASLLSRRVTLRAKTLGKARQYSEAIGQLKEAIRLKPELAEAHFALGLAYLSIGDRQKALNEVDALSRIDSRQATQLRSLIDRGL